MAQYTVDLPCILDTYIDRNNPSANFGSLLELQAGALTFEGWASSGGQGPNGEHYDLRYITMLKFDYSALPANKTITSAKLRLYSNNHVSNTNPDTYPLLPLVLKPLWRNFTESETYSSYMLEGEYHEWITKNGVRSTIDPPAGQYIDLEFIALLNSTDVRNKGIAVGWEVAGELIYNSQGPVWQISARNSTKPPLIRVTYEDTLPDKPTVSSPVGMYLDSTKAIRFSWQYNSSVGGTQKKFDLLWSTNSTTWNTVSQTTSNNYYDMAANTLTPGNVYWKVKTYNANDEASPESDIAVFYVTGAPIAPNIINVTTNTARPVITWGAASQQIYQLQILKDNNIIYDTGNVASTTIKTHKITDFLADSGYTARIRVKNEYDLFSDWASFFFTISTTKPYKPQVGLSRNKYSITALSNILNNSYLLLYRSEISSNDFKCVTKSLTDILIDNTIESNKQYQYFVRTVNSLEAYNDSDIKVTYSPKIDKSIFAPISYLGNIFEVKVNLNDRPAKNITINTPNTSNYFSGRKYPVIEYSEHFSKGVSLSFFIQDDKDYQQLLEIIYLKGIVLYRDSRRKLYGNISGLNITDHYAGYIISLTISQTDYTEELEV
ncbi:MAG: hypothetical protein K0R50_1247 [Eubacterium sp.]|jgi:hypothetical protein|nr:hypothetical protein [Eubacterium sp.]